MLIPTITGQLVQTGLQVLLGGLQKQGGSRDIEGVATIGSHSNSLTAWSNIAINPDNYVNVSIGTVDAKGYRFAVTGV